ncbi:hypothetical protein [Rhodohalobacter halophilus]|uniref:hypothetical protein n=1 Tax=Rhodohalobacter halophilus TaxID=1812810 RepID=UPI00083F7DF7|nr:hypothetical protein [Rhodohalobacter halophilus]
MQWIKNIIVDLITTLVIALVVFFESTPALTYVIFIYTGLMVLARTFTLFSGNFRAITKKQVSEVPVWIYHLLYLLNVLFLGVGAFYITAAGWVYIWGVAAYVHKQQS